MINLDTTSAQLLGEETRMLQYDCFYKKDQAVKDKTNKVYKLFSAAANTLVRDMIVRRAMCNKLQIYEKFNDMSIGKYVPKYLLRQDMISLNYRILKTNTLQSLQVRNKDKDATRS